MIKLLIVDDSALMRKHLAAAFEAEGDFEVRLARNGTEATEENLRYLPDVVTLDINMPEMDGITALSLMMAQRPVPVVMVSSLTEKGALATFEALNLGAVDYVAKPGGTISLSLDAVKADLITKVRAASGAKAKGMTHRPLRAPTQATPRAGSPVQGLAQRLRDERMAAERQVASTGNLVDRGAVLIGVSTGGPRALEVLLPQLPADFALPVVVAQHMPASFTAPFAARLDGICPLRVTEVSSPMPMLPGSIYIGKGGADLLITRRGTALTVLPKPESPEHLWHPSVELLGQTALEHINPARLIGVMLTGMGSDGANSFSEIKRRGGRTVAESEDSAVVFGMPGELVKRSGASMVLPLDKIATQVKSWASK